MAELKKIEDTPKKKTSPRKRTRKRKTPVRDFMWKLVMYPLLLIAVGYNLIGAFTTFSGTDFLYVPLVSFLVVVGIGSLLAMLTGTELDD
jgi:hypothetical protein